MGVLQLVYVLSFILEKGRGNGKRKGSGIGVEGEKGEEEDMIMM